MKKIIFLLIVFLLSNSLYPAKLKNIPVYYMYDYIENGQKNFFPIYINTLEQKYGINVFIYKDTEKVKFDVEHRARTYFNNLNLKKNEKAILLWVSFYNGKGKILFTDNLKSIFNEKQIKILENEVINKLTGKWYVGEMQLYTKIFGTLVYMVEKENLTKKDLIEQKSKMIFIDDFLFNLTVIKPFSDILNLFYFEPISFVFYFPFVTYFIFVRIIGYNFGLMGLKISNYVWSAFMLFIIFLIINKINILFPEYVNLFLFFCALNLPVYVYFYFIYREDIECAIYNYLNSITGGFYEECIFKN